MLHYMSNKCTYKKCLSLEKSFKKKFSKVGRRLSRKQKLGEDRMSNRNKQNNNWADRKMESNDSPEIPDSVEGRYLRSIKNNFFMY